MSETIRTNLGNTYEAEYAWGPIYNGQCQLAIYDERRLPVIADEFDGLEWIEMTTEDARTYRFEGFSLLRTISLDTMNNRRLIRMALEKEMDDHVD